MRIKKYVCLLTVMAAALCLFACTGPDQASEKKTEKQFVEIRDDTGRMVRVPEDVEHIICSGPGCLRLVAYLQAEKMVTAVDDIETRLTKFDARPYALANPQFKQKPIFGQFRGLDNPELILGLETQPDVILKTYPNMGHDPAELEKKTGIPVVAMNYGTFVQYRKQLYNTLRTFGKVLDREQRAAEVINFFENEIQTLAQRTADIPQEEKKTCFVGGIAFKGPHGFQSTEPMYPPFVFIGARSVLLENVDADQDVPAHTDIAKEKIVDWDPDILFLDLSTIQNSGEASALYQLRNDPAYKDLTAVKEGKVYGVLPYNWYSRNFGSILADAFYVGKILYPERFQDIDPGEKADEIYDFLVGGEVFKAMDESFENQAFKPIEMES
ncbi:MAG: iron ABC transporter substrate-binding protein [Desulfovibrionales bacterium]